MAFSCNFKTLKTKEAKTVWKLSSPNNVIWKVEVEWMPYTYDYYRNSYVARKIILQSEEISDFWAELNIFGLNLTEQCFLRYQDLSKNNVITISENDYYGKLTGNRSEEYICLINFFPCCPLKDVCKPVPLTKTKMLIDTVEPKTEKKLEKMASDMLSLLKDGLCSDVGLTVGDLKIKAHKCILSARSAVFAKMFTMAMKENLKNEVRIEDIEGPVLREMVSYMYSGIIILKEAHVVRGLYIAADKYAINELKALCSSWLKSTTMETVLDTLILAEMYKDKDLKQEAMIFISKNISVLKAQNTWRSFQKEHPLLSIEVLEYVIDNQKA